jgi:type I restriction-modification system DNA methylase subunit
VAPFFRDIFGKKKDSEIGFDIVIANPPYGVDVDKSIQEHYGLGKRDSYGVFMSMALKKLLKAEGHLCYIVSDTWLTISSHFQLRQQILDCHHLQKVIRLHGDCFKATVNSCIVTVQTTAANKKHNSADDKSVWQPTLRIFLLEKT